MRRLARFESSTNIEVQDFRMILLWPMRIKPTGRLKAERDNDQHGSSKWIKAYSEHIVANGKWRRVGSYRDDAARQTPVPRHERYAEYAYFHPFIQRILYTEGEDAPIAIFSRDDVRFAHVQLRDGETEWKCPVERVNLFLFPTDLAIAAIQLDNPKDVVSHRPFQLSDALDFLDWTRRAYPPYFWEDREGVFHPGKVPARVTWEKSDGTRWTEGASDFAAEGRYLKEAREGHTPVGEHWRVLLHPLDVKDPDGNGLMYKQVEDDRFPVIASIAVADPAAISPGDWVRLAFCDDQGNSKRFPYSEKFLADFEKENTYGRFWDPENGFLTRYLMTGYSFLAIGKAGDFDLIAKHVQQHYFLLFLLAHMKKASLLAFARRLSDLVHDFECDPASDSSKDDLRRRQHWLLNDLTDFVSRFYFSEVSNQLQAIELFDRMTAHLHLKQSLREVVEQSEFVSRVLEAEWQAQMAKRQERLADEGTKLAKSQKDLAEVANKWIPVGVGASILGISLGLETWGNGFVKWLAGWWAVPEPWVGLGVAVVAFLLVIFIVRAIFPEGGGRK